MAKANENQWREFWQRVGADGDPAPTWQRLYAAYTESWRAYHNLEHIGDCLEEFAPARQLTDNPTAVEAAIWFHDVIYDTRGKDNEERSADAADIVFSATGLPKAFRQNVRSLILATKHNQPPSGKDASLLVDIDLSILGQSHERYAKFERQIRSEYAWVSDTDFAAGRSTILKSFLARKTVFLNETFVGRYEIQARENLTWALAQLSR